MQTTVKILGLRGEYVYDASPSSGGRRPSVRGCIKGYSTRSASRLRAYLAASEAEYGYMVTLTLPSWLPGSSDPNQAKTWLHAWFDRMRREYWRGESRRHSCVWVMELTQAEAIHFHCVLNHWVDQYWVARAWYEVVGSLNAYHLKAGTRTERLRKDPSRYLSKYLSKVMLGDQALLSRHREGFGRWWGVRGRRDVVVAALRVREALTDEDKAAQASVFSQFEALMEGFVASGSAQRVVFDEELPVRCWRIPSKGLRRRIRARFMAWKYDLSCAGGWPDDADGMHQPA